MIDATCRTCTFRRESRCRRFPPTAGVGAPAIWPVTKDEDWCGEHPDRQQNNPASEGRRGQAKRPAPAKRARVAKAEG